MSLHIQLCASIWMIMSAFLYSLQNVDARYSGSIFGFWTMCFFRGFFGSFLCVLFLCLQQIYSKHLDISFHRNIKLLLVRSILGGFSIITSFFAILKCDLSTTTIITSTSSLWTALIGYKISPDKYKWGVIDILVSLWCIGGIVILSTNTHENVYFYIGIISALLSAILQSCVNLTIKQLQEENPVWVALWGMVGSVVLSFPGLVYEITTTFHHQHFARATFIEWLSITTTGIVSASAQICKTHSIQISNSMSVIVLRYMDSVFSVLWDIFIFKEKFTWHTITGVVIVFAGCLFKFIFEYYHSHSKNSTTKLPLHS